MNTRRLNTITAIAVIASVIACFAMLYLPKSAADSTSANTAGNSEYAKKLFGTDMIEINIDIDKTAWQSLLDNAASETYSSCNLTINGTEYQSVGIRAKGNSSLTTVANSDSDRFSFKFEFDKYIKGQTCFGLDKFVVNNMQNDYTYMKEYISYYLMNYMGVESPLFKYAHITVNGEEWGLYLAVESYENSFLERAYNTTDGNLYSVKMTTRKDQDSNADNISAKTAGANDTAANNTNINNTGANNRTNNISGRFAEGMGKGMGMGATNGGSLVYTDDNISSYSSIFDNTVLKSTDEANNKKVIEALKALSEGKDLEKYFDVDEILRYLAVHTTVVNLDSYVSNMQQNYYIYEKDGKITILPWDYNLAFGGFQAGSASSAVNFPIDTPVSGVELSQRPLIAKLLEVDEYKAKYHEYLKQVAEYLNSNKFTSQVNDINSLITGYVKKDATAFCTFDQYTSAVKTFTEFCKLRAESMLGQLSGSIPSTASGQQDTSKLVAASSINLSTMGTQGGGGMQPPGVGYGYMQMPFNGYGSMQLPEDRYGNMQLPGDGYGIMQPPGDGYGNMQVPAGSGKEFGRGGMRNNNGDQQGMQPPDMGNGNFGGQGRPDMQNNKVSGTVNKAGMSSNSLIWLGASLLVLVFGLGFTMFFRRRAIV